MIAAAIVIFCAAWLAFAWHRIGVIDRQKAEHWRDQIAKEMTLTATPPRDPGEKIEGVG